MAFLSRITRLKKRLTVNDFQCPVWPGSNLYLQTSCGLQDGFFGCSCNNVLLIWSWHLWSHYIHTKTILRWQEELPRTLLYSSAKCDRHWLIKWFIQGQKYIVCGRLRLSSILIKSKSYRNAKKVIHSVVVKGEDSGTRLPGVRSHLYHWPALWLCASYLTSLWLNFPHIWNQDNNSIFIIGLCDSGLNTIKTSEIVCNIIHIFAIYYEFSLKTTDFTDYIIYLLQDVC